MPKDLIHFKVAQLTADRLADTDYAPCLSASPQSLLFGSVFHDALFYGVTNPAKPLETLAHTLHGADGQDTYALLRLQSEHAATATDRNIAASLLVGMTSHVFADVVMHPMVWHMSGDYYATDGREKSMARQRHRALESLMDMVACPEMIGRPLYTVHRLLRSLGNDLYDALPIDQLADMAGISPTTARFGIRSTFRIYSGLQRSYKIAPLAGTLFRLMPVLPDSAREIAALFYAPPLMDQANGVSGTINYRHPVTGEALSTTIRDMMDEAANQAADLCRTMTATVFNGKQSGFSSPGPSMDAGLSQISTTAMRHFADPPFPKLP